MRIPTGLTSERRVSNVPRPVLAVLVLALAGQLTWQALRPAPAITVAALPDPPPAGVLEVVGLGEQSALARMLMLWLQAFDYQPGISVPLGELDYATLAAWLGAILELDPRSHYPLLSAARVYGAVADPDRQRLMLEFVRERFLERPAERWPWLAHAVYVAKHRMKDLELALEYARTLRQHTPPDAAPDWARQMEFFVLEDMGREESARVLLGGLIESGVITDPNQIEFLKQRLGEMGPE